MSFYGFGAYESILDIQAGRLGAEKNMAVMFTDSKDFNPIRLAEKYEIRRKSFDFINTIPGRGQSADSPERWTSIDKFHR